MDYRKIFFVIIILSLPFILSACGGSSNSGGNIQVSYLPNFAFSANTSNNFVTQSMIPPDDIGHIKSLYYIYSPALLGFKKNSQSFSNGDQISCPFLNTTLRLTISASHGGKIITFDGHLDDDPSATIKIVLDTENKKFAYEQYLILEDNPDATLHLNAKYVIVYSSLSDVPFTDDGYFQTITTTKFLIYVEENTGTKIVTQKFGYVVKNDCYAGLALNGTNMGHYISGYYTSLMKNLANDSRFDIVPADSRSLQRSTFITLFDDFETWGDGDGSILNTYLYFDHDQGQFFSNEGPDDNNTEKSDFYKPANYLNESRPWDLTN